MKLLFKYIIAQFLKNISILMVSFISIYVLIDFFEKIDNFSERGKSMGLVVKFFLLNIPFVLDQVSPVCILLAGVITLGLLNSSNELIALKAGGIPLKTIIKPIVVGGLIFTLIFLVMAQFVLPKTIAMTNKIWIEEVKGQVPLGIYRNGRYYYKGKDGFYSFSRPSPQKNQFQYFSYATWDEEFRLSSLITAKRAEWKNGEWKMFNGQMQTATGANNFHTEVYQKNKFGLPEQPADFFVPEFRSMEHSLLGLYKNAKRAQTKDDAARAWTEFFGRISYTLLGLPLMLLGLPLLLIVYRKWGRDLSLAIPVSCGLAFACWGVWGTLQSMAKVNYLNPLLASFSVQVVVIMLAGWLLLREDL